MKKSSFNFTTAVIMLLLVSCDNSSPSIESASYAKDIVPVLQSHCLKCHNKEGDGYKISGLNMESYSALMTGTKFGPVIVPGSAVSSTLVRVISGKADPAITMPHGGMQLMKEQDIRTIANWIDQGALNN